MRTALVTGITGQDGRYLAPLLLARGYAVAGTARNPPARPLPAGVAFHRADAGDALTMTALLEALRPDEVYHLAAETSVERSWDAPAQAVLAAQGGATALLDAVQAVVPAARVFVASSAEVFSATTHSPQDEGTPLAPGSPYGEGKAIVLRQVRERRGGAGMYLAAGILYNHESPIRSPRFVSRKITSAVAAIAAGRASELRLGNLEGRRDWGFAGDYADAMWRTLQADAPTDYVIGTGVSRSVAELCEVAFAVVGLAYRSFVVSDPLAYRPADSAVLVANPSRALRLLGWRATTSFAEMIRAMVEADMDRLRRGEA